METILSQTLNNTTLWVGHLSHDTNDHVAGQTFSCPDEGSLDSIQVYSAAVPHPGELLLTLHEFDCGSRNWGPPIAKSRQFIERSDEKRWIRFELDPVMLKKNSCYGFQLQSKDACIGLGEAVTNAKTPFTFGPSWSKSRNNGSGDYYNYFSLAFKVMVA
jgi:hypothetical protein